MTQHRLSRRSPAFSKGSRCQASQPQQAALCRFPSSRRPCYHSRRKCDVELTPGCRHPHAPPPTTNLPQNRPRDQHLRPHAPPPTTNLPQNRPRDQVTNNRRPKSSTSRSRSCREFTSRPAAFGWPEGVSSLATSSPKTSGSANTEASSNTRPRSPPGFPKARKGTPTREGWSRCSAACRPRI